MVETKRRIDRREAEKKKARVAREYQKILEEWTVLPEQDRDISEYRRRFEEKLDADLHDTYEVRRGLSWWVTNVIPFIIAALFIAAVVLVELEIVTLDSVLGWGIGAFFIVSLLVAIAEKGKKAVKRIKEEIRRLSWNRAYDLNRKLQESYEKLEWIEPLARLLPSIDTLQIRVTSEVPENRVKLFTLGGRTFAMIRRIDAKHLFMAINLHISNTPAKPEFSSVINKHPHIRTAIELNILESLLKEADLEKELGTELEEKKRQAFTNAQVQHSYSSLKNISNELISTGKSMADLGLGNVRTLLLESERHNNDDTT